MVAQNKARDYCRGEKNHQGRIDRLREHIYTEGIDVEVETPLDIATRANGFGWTIKIIDRNLTKLIDPGCEFLSVKTDKDWITIAQTSVLYLIVVADRKADDLLSVRISRSLGMISSHVKDKYPALLFFDKPAEQKSVKRWR